MEPSASKAPRRLGVMIIPFMRLPRAVRAEEADVGGQRADEAGEGGGEVAQGGKVA